MFDGLFSQMRIRERLGDAALSFSKLPPPVPRAVAVDATGVQ
ncbi:hypothetical protein GRAN_0973 [Granulicella sibirica]|uniref:Uncharacterized protein n=1 Tax=Granulicella sibirica TaxID=2479048 RepID=A0A4Q0T241_9BACT|nr:hypothetical protein GRAN_0973 [Granulicella sibirica]